MSATIIARIYALAEPPAVPPFIVERGSAAADEASVSAQDFTQIASPEVGSTSAELVETGASEGSPAVGDDAPGADAAGMFADVATPAPGSDPALWLYRDRTVALLRRYMRLSIEVGRLPSLLGREFFRARVTSYKASTFEDSVIFVHDVERSLEKLNEFQKQLIAKIALQEYSQEEAGRLLGCGLRHAARCYLEALDRVSEIFLKRELLTRLPQIKPAPPKSCQGGQIDEFPVSDSEEAKNKF